MCVYVYVCVHAHASHTHSILCHNPVQSYFRVPLHQVLVLLPQNLHVLLMSSDIEVLQQGIMDKHILLLWGSRGGAAGVGQEGVGQQGWGSRSGARGGG